MPQTHVISGLVKKRAEIDGQLNFHNKKVAQLKAELVALDESILIFEPEYNIKEIQMKRPMRNNKYFEKGQRSKAIMDVLRESGKFLSSEEIASQIASQQSMTLDSKEFGGLVATIVDGLRDLRMKEIVRETSRVNNQPRYTIS